MSTLAIGFTLVGIGLLYHVFMAIAYIRVLKKGRVPFHLIPSRQQYVLHHKQRAMLVAIVLLLAVVYITTNS